MKGGAAVGPLLSPLVVRAYFVVDVPSLALRNTIIQSHLIVVGIAIVFWVCCLTRHGNFQNRRSSKIMYAGGAVSRQFCAVDVLGGCLQGWPQHRGSKGLVNLYSLWEVIS